MSTTRIAVTRESKEGASLDESSFYEHVRGEGPTRQSSFRCCQINVSRTHDRGPTNPRTFVSRLSRCYGSRLCPEFPNWVAEAFCEY